MNSHFYAVIMAGGGGTRLWPVSRKKQPKQFLKLTDDRSLFRIALDRISPILPLENIKIVTVRDQIEDLSREVNTLSEDNFLVEPFPKGTAAVVGLAAIILKQIDPDSVMAVLTADHLIENTELFQQLLQTAYGLANEEYLVTLGITPTFPSTGYGYIKAGEQINNREAFRVHRFVEKPIEKIAEEYLNAGGYYWNSGMFIWRSDRILREFERQMPKLFKQLIKISQHYGDSDFYERLHEYWQDIEPQTIDYGIMENAKDVTVLPAANLGWSDIGSWDSLYQTLERDKTGNYANFSRIIEINSKNNLVFSENKDKIIALIDLEDLVIIQAEDALLVCKKGQSEKVRQIIDKMKKNGMDTYL
jgi:mannose-1-phosphate guanylyltransferase